MRLVFAALFVYAGISVVGIALANPQARTSPVIYFLAITAAITVLLIFAMIVFNYSKNRPIFDPMELMERGLLLETKYQAQRAFRIESYEDEGAHYFIELADKTVLYLNGPYLIDYDLDEQDDEAKTLPAFPCSEFTVRRHRTKGYAVGIVCAGERFAVEATIDIDLVIPPAPKDDCLHGIALNDGLVLPGLSYDQIKERFTQTP